MMLDSFLMILAGICVVGAGMSCAMLIKVHGFLLEDKKPYDGTFWSMIIFGALAAIFWFLSGKIDPVFIGLFRGLMGLFAFISLCLYIAKRQKDRMIALLVFSGIFLLLCFF